MRSEYSLSDKECIVMKAIWQEWDGEHPLQTKQFLPHLAQYNWSGPLIFTFIRRLEEKGLLKSKRSDTSRRENIYYPLISEEEWKYTQSKAFIKSIHGGYRGLILNLLNNDEHSDEVINQIQAVLDEYERKS